jgi:hypothetical protein
MQEVDTVGIAEVADSHTGGGSPSSLYRMTHVVLVGPSQSRCPSREEVRDMGQPGAGKKKGLTVLEKRRIKREKLGAPVKRRRKSAN